MSCVTRMHCGRLMAVVSATTCGPRITRSLKRRGDDFLRSVSLHGGGHRAAPPPSADCRQRFHSHRRVRCSGVHAPVRLCAHSSEHGSELVAPGKLRRDKCLGHPPEVAFLQVHAFHAQRLSSRHPHSYDAVTAEAGHSSWHAGQDVTQELSRFGNLRRALSKEFLWLAHYVRLSRPWSLDKMFSLSN